MASGRAQQAAGTPSPHVVAGQQRQLVHGEAEVKRLEQDVRQQESDSQRASERLQEQDRTIAELQKQLQALRSGQAGQQH